MSTSTEPIPPACLRCGAKLDPLPVQGSVAFFECPDCKRHYARVPGRGLTFRWRHPISLALYGCVPFPSIRGGESDAVRALVQGRSGAELAAIADEIQLELDHPTQQVRDILGNAAPEAECRAFLAEVVRQLRAA